MKSILVWRWLLAGVAYIIIAIPSILGKVPPNSWWGFRVAKTFSDERIWYAANRVMGYDLLIAGVVIAIGAVVTTKLMLSNSRRANRICFLMFLLSSLAALAHGFWALDRM